MNLFFINTYFILPGLITAGIPALLAYYYLTRDAKKSGYVGLYTSLIFITIFSISDLLGINAVFNTIAEPLYSLIVAGVAVLSVYLLVNFYSLVAINKIKEKELMWYVGVISLIIELAVAYGLVALPVMALL